MTVRGIWDLMLFNGGTSVGNVAPLETAVRGRRRQRIGNSKGVEMGKELCPVKNV